MDEALVILDELCAVRAGRSTKSESALLSRLLQVTLPMDSVTWAACRKQMWRQWPAEVAKRANA